MIHPPLPRIIESLPSTILHEQVIARVNRRTLAPKIPTPTTTYSWGEILSELRNQGYRPASSDGAACWTTLDPSEWKAAGLKAR